MTEFISFFVVLGAALLFPAMFQRLHLPWVVALIIAGILIGPAGTGWLELNETIEFLGEIGLVFLMFMAGLETKLSSFKSLGRDVGIMTIFNGFGPLVFGVLIGVFIGLSWSAAFLIGTIFMSTSVGVVLPSLSANKLVASRLGRTIIAGAVVEDVLSLILLSVLLQTFSPVTALPLWVFYPIVALVLFALKWGISRLRWLMGLGGQVDVFQQELRFLVAALVGVVVLFEVLGLHPILAGFFAGLILADTIQHEVMKEKLRVISYGIFVPIFFVVVGAQADIAVLFTAASGAMLLLAIVVGSLLSKFVGGVVAGHFLKLPKNEQLLLASATLPQLSTTLAATFVGVEVGIINEAAGNAIIVLTIVSTLLSPLLVRYFAERVLRDRVAVV